MDVGMSMRKSGSRKAIAGSRKHLAPFVWLLAIGGQGKGSRIRVVCTDAAVGF